VSQDGPVPDFVRVHAADPDLQRLTRDVVLEYAERYGDEDGEIAPVSDEADWILVRDDDGSAVACGGVQPWSHSVTDAAAGTGELKRMYVVPSARGRGLSRRLLDELVGIARQRGMTTLVLETGTGQPEAMGLYESYGFALTETWGEYRWDPRSRCYRLDLATL
jgi:GNAT superfamily N-acetyltransferase